MNLYQKYTGESLDEIFGHDKIVKEWRTRFKERNFPKATLIYGKPGTGKTLICDIIAKSLVCLNIKEDGQPCNECANCLDIKNERFEKAVIYRNGSDLNINEVRELRKKLMFSNNHAANQLVIVNELQAMAEKSPEALESLLDMLAHKTYQNIYFILVSMNSVSDFKISDELRKAISRRCSSYYLRSVPDDKILTLLNAIYVNETNKNPDENVLKLLMTIVHNSEGSPGTAISYLERLILSEITNEEDLFEELGLVSENKIIWALTALFKGEKVNFFNQVPNVNSEIYFKIKNALIILYQLKSGVDVGYRGQYVSKFKDIDELLLITIIEEFYKRNSYYISDMIYTLLEIIRKIEVFNKQTKPQSQAQEVQTQPKTRERKSI